MEYEAEPINNSYSYCYDYRIFCLNSNSIVKLSEKNLKLSSDNCADKLDSWMSEIIAELNIYKDTIETNYSDNDDKLLKYLKTTYEDYHEAYPMGLYVEGMTKEHIWMLQAGCRVMAGIYLLKGHGMLQAGTAIILSLVNHTVMHSLIKCASAFQQGSCIRMLWGTCR